MLSEEKQILRMLEDGKLTSQEALKLLDVLEEQSLEDEVDSFETEASPRFASKADENLSEIADQVRSFWMIPLWIGIGFTVLGGVWMLAALRSSSFGFWFYCAWLPFLLGVFVIVLVTGSRSSRWLFVRIKQTSDKTPENIAFGFPLPLKFSAWILRTFGHMIPGVESVALDELLEALANTPTDKAALIVDVHDDDDGEHVQIFVD